MLADSGWTEKIFAYCERGDDPSFWAEPLNAWSNAAFWVAAAGFAVALVIHRDRLREGAASGSFASPTGPAARDLWLLVVLLIGIGAGSFLFHTFAEPWSGMADVGCIVLWVLWYLWVSARRVLRWGRGFAAGALVVHLALSVLLLMATGWFLMSYLPTAAAAYLLALHAARFPLPGREALLGSAVTFTVSMVMAGLDRPLCDLIPTGTHFVWHLLNAAALLLASLGLMKNVQQPAQRVTPHAA
ncbi:MAG: hypothetical protein ACE37H_03855 [Phycisphaeraceae bacterium]